MQLELFQHRIHARFWQTYQNAKPQQGEKCSPESTNLPRLIPECSLCILEILAEVGANENSGILNILVGKSSHIRDSLKETKSHSRKISSIPRRGDAFPRQNSVRESEVGSQISIPFSRLKQRAGNTLSES